MFFNYDNAVLDWSSRAWLHTDAGAACTINTAKNTRARKYLNDALKRRRGYGVPPSHLCQSNSSKTHRLRAEVRSRWERGGVHAQWGECIPSSWTCPVLLVRTIVVWTRHCVLLPSVAEDVRSLHRSTAIRVPASERPCFVLETGPAEETCPVVRWGRWGPCWVTTKPNTQFAQRASSNMAMDDDIYIYII